MKKNILALAVAFGVTGAFAQDKKRKESEPFLPDQGDWAIEQDPIDFTNNSSPFTNPKPEYSRPYKSRKKNNRKGHKRKKAKNGRN